MLPMCMACLETMAFGFFYFLLSYLWNSVPIYCITSFSLFHIFPLSDFLMFYPEYVSGRPINQKPHESPDKKKSAGLLHNPSEELKPNHALGDSLFIFSSCIKIKEDSALRLVSFLIFLLSM